MNTLSQESSAKFIRHNPTQLLMQVNIKGQTVIFFEHPLRGDEAPIYARINEVVVNTGFYDLADFDKDSGYIPVLTESGEIVCEFELED